MKTSRIFKLLDVFFGIVGLVVIVTSFYYGSHKLKTSPETELKDLKIKLLEIEIDGLKYKLRHKDDSIRLEYKNKQIKPREYGNV